MTDPPARAIAGRYRLERPLGEGGHGEVWEAEDRLTGEIVAVKLLRSGLRMQAARVRREVAALRLLRLPGVVRLIDEGVDEERPFLVMERIAGSPFPGVPTPCRWPVLAKTTATLLETLARVHASGVIHRDLKPANVLVSDDGRPTILDFGLSVGSTPLGGELTEEGDLLGTPAYLAPEQITGEPATARTDLYALGVMLYAALAGRLPHEAPDLMGMMRARLMRRPVPLRDLAPESPADVIEVIEQLLAIEVSDRPRSAAEVLGMLRGQPALTAPSLPWLGPDTAVEALVAAARAGRSLSLAGPPGAGRTRCLREAAERLTNEGRRVLHLAPARRPFSSLQPLLGSLDDHASQRLPEVIAHVERTLRAALAAGVVILADDVERLDRESAAALARCRDAGSVLWSTSESGIIEGEQALAPLTQLSLRALFAGPDRLLHLREDAAHELWKRTRGLPTRVSYEVDAWVRAGLARWDGAVLRIDRDALDRLDTGLHVTADDPVEGAAPSPLPPHLDELLAWIALAAPHGDVDLLATARAQPPWRVAAEVDELVARGAARLTEDGRLAPQRTARAHQSWPYERRHLAHRAIADALPAGAPGRLFHLVAGSEEARSADVIAIATEARHLGRRLGRDGQLGKAVVVIAEGLRALHKLSPAPEEESTALLSLWTEIALLEATPPALDRVLYELCRVEPRTPAIAHLEALVRAALAVGVWTDRTLAIADAVPPFEDVGLERRRNGMRVTAARRCSLPREEEVLAEIAAWAARSDERENHASLAGWLGRLRYRQGRFDEAAELQMEAADGTAWTTSRIGALLNGASARIEAFRSDDAAVLLRQALDLSRACRHTLYEARSEWLLRVAAYRSGVATEPDHELLEAFARAGVAEMEGFVCLNEAAVAWRGALAGDALELARRARGILVRAGEPLAALLASCMELTCGISASAGEAEALLKRALVCPMPRVRLQALGLLAMAGQVMPAVAKASAVEATAAIPVGCRRMRMEILSVDEALTALNPQPSSVIP